MATGVSIPLRGLEGIPGLPGAPQDEAGLTRKFETSHVSKCVQLFVTTWTATHQASLSSTVSWSLLKLTSIESVMLSSHLILCHPLLL